ncbi:MAG: hypothetical protein ACI9D5_001352 [Candidatus Endobugula sp.]|jgi:hypothetical protein
MNIAEKKFSHYLLRMFLVIIVVSLTACKSNDINDYSENKPILDVKTFFNGELLATGIVKDLHGQLIRYFTAEIQADWKGETGTLKEIFYFNDGKTEYRDWTLTMKTPNHFIGTAGDVIGEANGHQSGNAIFMQYILEIPYKEKTIEVTVDDKMYLVSDDTIINESRLYKYGVKVGEVVLTIQKK